MAGEFSFFSTNKDVVSPVIDDFPADDAFTGFELDFVERLDPLESFKFNDLAKDECDDFIFNFQNNELDEEFGNRSPLVDDVQMFRDNIFKTDEADDPCEALMWSERIDQSGNNDQADIKKFGKQEMEESAIDQSEIFHEEQKIYESPVNAVTDASNQQEAPKFSSRSLLMKIGVQVPKNPVATATINGAQQQQHVEHTQVHLQNVLKSAREVLFKKLPNVNVQKDAVQEQPETPQTHSKPEYHRDDILIEPLINNYSEKSSPKIAKRDSPQSLQKSRTVAIAMKRLSAYPESDSSHEQPQYRVTKTKRILPLTTLPAKRIEPPLSEPPKTFTSITKQVETQAGLYGMGFLNRSVSVPIRERSAENENSNVDEAFASDEKLNIQITAADIESKLQRMDVGVSEEQTDADEKKCNDEIRKLSAMCTDLELMESRVTDLLVDSSILKTDFLLLRDPALEDRVLDFIEKYST